MKGIKPYSLWFVQTISLFIQVFLLQCTYCQNRSFEITGKLSVTDGLPFNLINDLYQDQYQFIWIGTNNGLVRYDGSNLKVYKNNPYDSTTLQGNRIASIIELTNGNLLLGTNGKNGGLNLFDRHEETFKLILASKDYEDPESDKKGIIQKITKDNKENIWIGTSFGLVRYNLGTNTLDVFKSDTSDLTSLSNNNIQGLQFDGNRLWIGCADGVLHQYNPETNDFKKFINSNIGFGEYEFPWQIRDMILDKNNHILILYYNGFSRFNIKTQRFQNFLYKEANNNGLSNPSALKIFQDSKDRVWIGTIEGLNLFRPENNSFQKFYHQPFNKKSLSGNHIVEIWQDSFGMLWICSVFEGANIMSLQGSHVQYFKNYPGNDNSLPYDDIRYVHRDRNGFIWFGTQENGFIKYDPKTDLYKLYQRDPKNPYSLLTDRVRHFKEDSKNLLWITTDQTRKLRLFDIDKEEFISFPAMSQLDRYKIYSFFIDSKDNIWLVTSFTEIIKLDKDRKSFKVYDFIRNSFEGESAAIMETQKGKIFVLGGGIYSYNEENDQFDVRFLEEEPQDQLYINWDDKHDFFEDHEGKILGAIFDYGIIEFDPFTNELRNYSKEIENAPEFSINSFLLEKTEKGELLFSNGNRQIFLYDPLKKTFKQIFKSDIEPSNTLYAHTDYEGNHYLSGKNGVHSFNLKKSSINNIPPKTHIIDLKLFGTSLKIGENKILKTPTYSTSDIHLKYNQNDLTFEYVGIHTKNPELHSYRYKLEPFHKDWVDAGNARAANFPNLAAGKYVFKVISANADGVWDEEGAKLNIYIAPPWWLTTTAYILYGLATIICVIFIYKFQKKRLLEKAQLAYKQKETLHLKELDQLKTNLYTNITHEFRTPLTIISGMADQIKINPSEWLNKGSEMIKRNSEHLLSLVNQLLDLQKLESGNIQLQLVQTDIVRFLKYIIESFDSLAKSKSIALHFLPEVDSLLMDVDTLKLQQIVSNLLSNAIKFTPENGHIYFHLNEKKINAQPYLEFKIRDTGVGIPEDKLIHIFDRFYQINSTKTRNAEGTGIGLALTKELVEILNGTIQVDSKLNQGSIFIVLLPVFRNASLNNELPKVELSKILFTEKNKTYTTHDLQLPTENEIPTLLLIEDNQDVIEYIMACLKGSYRLDFARNGQEGINKALETVPDIIISDVMMPVMDGFEVCNTLKNDERTSHIPIIILTAKIDYASRIEGLEQGADVYLSKPFQEVELKVRLRKLIELRRNLQAHYSKLEPIPESENNHQSLEDAFLIRARKVVEEHISQPNFIVPDFCRAMGISRTQLHNKLKALTGRSATSYIRGIRLQRGQELLRTSNMTVSEVAYEVGFNDPNYFSRCYSEEFGQNPSEHKSS